MVGGHARSTTGRSMMVCRATGWGCRTDILARSSILQSGETGADCNAFLSKEHWRPPTSGSQEALSGQRHLDPKPENQSLAKFGNTYAAGLGGSQKQCEHRRTTQHAAVERVGEAISLQVKRKDLIRGRDCGHISRLTTGICQPSTQHQQRSLE